MAFLLQTKKHLISLRSSTIFSTPLPDLIETISHIPSKSRYKGFTLNVLARLHPAWTESFQSLIPLILTTRILPKGLKLTGRTLIDKPKSTDKRPISVVQALDAHLDSIVNSRLAATVESLNVLDHTIAAYRKGKSCTDLTLNNILAIEDTCHYHNHILAHIDEDKEKYFDRISHELQLLPFHLLDFAPEGYLEWIAESLSNLKLDVHTPFGHCDVSFDCGVRQGSALSCTIANLVAWLNSTAWIDDPTPPTPSPPSPSHPR